MAEPDPIKAKCSRLYKAAHDSGSRHVSQIRHVVVHSTEGSTAAGAASWFANPASQGSGHLCVDPDICYRTLPDDRIAWGAANANTTGLHLEFAAMAAWKWRTWMSKRNRRMLRRGAYKAARWCKTYDVPVKWLSANAFHEGRDGIVTHANVNRAFPSTGHTDPGKGFPRRYFMRKVRKYKRQMR